MSDQRIHDIKFWKEELEKKLDDVYKEVDVLEAYKIRVEKAIDSIQEPLHIAQTCLANRYPKKTPTFQCRQRQFSFRFD